MNVDTYYGHLCSRDLINNEVITEVGVLLGWVRGFKFNNDTGKVSDLVIGLKRIPLIPQQASSTYELPIEEIISSGPNRLIVFEGAQERLQQLSIGFLELLGIGKLPWKHNKNESSEYKIQLAKDSWDEDGNPGSSPPILSPRRPGPRPGTNDSAELPLTEPESRHHGGQQTSSKPTLLS